MHGNNTKNLLVQLSLYQTSKNAMFFSLSFMLFLQQNRRTRRPIRFCPEAERGIEVAQIMYTLVSKC
jgi:hypothetical protein